MKNLSVARVATLIACAVFGLGLTVASGASVLPVLEYKFDEGSGPTAADSSSNHNTGTLSGGGGASFTSTAHQGPFAIALQATGNGLSWVQPTNNPLAGVTSFTIDAWVDPAAGASDNRSIFSNSPGGGTGNGFNFYLNNTGTSDHALVFQTHGATLTTGSIGNFGVYHNVAVTVSNAGSSPTVALYIDGQLATTTGSVANITDLTTLPRIGVFTDGNFNSNFFGNLDDVQVYNAALSAGQVLTLVPEPGSAGVVVIAAVCMALSRWRRQRGVRA